MHVPGLKVVAPSTPYDAKGCLIHAIRDPNPVMFVEHRMVHFQKGAVPEESYEVPFGRARILAPGKDVTIVGISYMAVEAMRAHSMLAEAGVDAEIIDPVSLHPLDVERIAASVRKTGRLLVVDCAWTTCGASAEITTSVLEALGTLGTGVRFRRLGHAPVTCPTTKSLENLYYPNSQTIASEAYALVRGDSKGFHPKATIAPEAIEFKGPF
jgi:pyruvate/2-oxoglutarate/acetoin dehydrogenase E1 component